MGWKTKQQLLDMEPNQKIECLCKGCGYVWYEMPAHHLHKSHMRQLCLDEFEKRLRCQQWKCKGKIMIALANEHETEGFKGGLA